MTRVKQIISALCLCLLMTLGNVPSVIAGPRESSSTNWGVSEVNFSSGGSLQSCGSEYCAKQSAGELVVGEMNSTNYRARGGANNFREEFLIVSVTGNTLNFGALDSTTTKSGSMTFSVRSFPAEGYSVIIDGFAPRNANGNSIANMTSAATSQVGVAQFGVNLKANTTPSLGAEPAHAPDGTFAFGVAAAGYDTANNFKFVPGDLIASSPKGMGQTNYTMSVIANVTTNTPSGTYSGRLALIAVPTF